MRAGYTRICRYAAQILLASSLLLGTLSGCGGHDVPHARTDGTTAQPVSAALPAAPPTTATSVEAVQSHPASISTAERTALPADSTALKRAQRTTSESAPEKAISSPSNTQATETEQGKTKAGTVTGEQNACAEITPEMVKQGRTVFTGKGNCTTCHGAEGKGNQLGPDLTDNKWLHISGDYPSIVGIVRKGVNLVIEHPTPMPAMGGSKLTDEEVCAVSAYVWSLTH